MSNEARKARKRAGEKYQPKPAKTPTGRYGDRESKGLGLMQKQEIMARALAAGRSLWERGF